MIVKKGQYITYKDKHYGAGSVLPDEADPDFVSKYKEEKVVEEVVAVEEVVEKVIEEQPIENDNDDSDGADEEIEENKTFSSKHKRRYKK